MGLALHCFIELLLVLFLVQNDQHYDTGQGHAENACPHADVAVVAGLRRGAGGLDCRLLHVFADLTGAGLFSVLSERRLFGDDPFAEGVGLLGYDHFAAARPFLLVGGLGGRPFLLAGVVVGILFAVFAAAAGAGCFLRAGGGAAGAADRLRVSLVTFADVGVRTVAVGRPLAPVVAEGGDGHVFGCVLGPVGFKGNLISPQASRKAGRLGDDGIVSRDSLVLHVGRVILADALRGTGIAGFGLRPCIRCRTPGMADGVKANVGAFFTA